MRENRTSGLTRGKGETNTTLPSLLYCFSVTFRDPAFGWCWVRLCGPLRSSITGGSSLAVSPGRELPFAFHPGRQIHGR